MQTIRRALLGATLFAAAGIDGASVDLLCGAREAGLIHLAKRLTLRLAQDHACAAEILSLTEGRGSPRRCAVAHDDGVLDGISFTIRHLCGALEWQAIGDVLRDVQLWNTSTRFLRMCGTSW